MMFCRKCRNWIPDDSAFCPKCGTAVIHNDGESTETPSGVDSSQNTETLQEFAKETKDGVSQGNNEMISFPQNVKSGSSLLDREENCSFCRDNCENIANGLHSEQGNHIDIIPCETESKSVLGNTKIKTGHSLRNFGVCTAIVSVAFMIWGSCVCNGSSRGFYHHPDYIFHIYGEYAWGLFLQTLGIILIGSFAMVCIAVELKNKNLQHSIIGVSIADVFCFSAAIYNLNSDDLETTEYIRKVKAEAYNRGTSITDKSDAIRHFYSDQAFFGRIFLILGIVISVVFAVSLAVYLTQKKNGKHLSGEVAYRSERNTRRVLVLTKLFVPTVIVSLMLIMYFNLRQFDYIQIGGKWYISHYYGSEAALSIPKQHFGSDVAGIAQNAFENSNITSITVSSISSHSFDIREKAFINCQQLEKIEFDSQIYTVNIGPNAFKDCVNLFEIEFHGRTYNSENGHKLSKINIPNQSRPSRIPSQNDDLPKADSWEAFEATQEASALQGFKCDKTAFTNCPKFTGIE